ncbi:uncharacterized protein UV8b_06150 [Ustilaginoidea virens]|uniref:Required for respiratory growth protein 9, mitochondrial n=1 Tax=Ustilaginoidea virens TaxID=1159556 RepID=A0A8E5HUQ4_USTVR|nr:uncharacterized protein UV8b_06150 [Ustilaginoidea virens]QUC21909.1 hypothetical protein UV8b_06150 [Ustilaginoidea virens]
MTCACRRAPWKMFVRAVAQVHNLSPAGAVRATWTAAPAAARPPFAVAAVRRFGTTPTQRHEAASPAAAGNSQTGRDFAEHKDDDASSAQQAAPAVRADEQPAPPRRPRKTNNADDNDGHDHDHDVFVGATGSSSSAPCKKTAAPAAPAASTKRGTRPVESGPDDGLSSPRPQAKPAARKDWQAQKEAWKVQKEALKQKFPEGWRPRKRLSPDALAGIRALNAQFPEVYTTQALADKFEVSPEVIRRILKSKWTPSAEEEQDRQERWFRRGKQVWTMKAALGVKPPRRWRLEGVARDVEWHERRERAVERERQRDEDEKRAERERRASGKTRGW